MRGSSKDAGNNFSPPRTADDNNLDASQEVHVQKQMSSEISSPTMMLYQAIIEAFVEYKEYFTHTLMLLKELERYVLLSALAFFPLLLNMQEQVLAFNFLIHAVVGITLLLRFSLSV